MNPTEKQIGGTHYKTAIQPVQYIHANGLNFFEGNVIKYITRHRSKGGKADLEKAIHYIEMLMEFEYPENSEDYENDPANYETEKHEGCIGCIFQNRGFCITDYQELKDYCGNNSIIYTSLKQ